VQRFLDAANALHPSDRSNDLEHARTAFIEATASAQSYLQKAIAERYLLLNALAQGRLDLAPTYLTDMESTTTAAAFEAMALTQLNRSYYDLLLAGKRPSGSDPVAPAEARTAALQSLELCGRLLAEGAALAPELGLPPRACPPTSIDINASGGPWQRDPLPLRAAARLVSRFEKPARLDPEEISFASNASKPYWTFDISAGKVLRLGSLTLELQPTKAVDRSGGSSSQLACLALGVPLPKPIVMHWVHARYFQHSDYLPEFIRRPGQSPVQGGLTSRGIPPSPKIPRTFQGWYLADPPTGIAVEVGALKAELPLRPVARSWGPMSLDPSRSAVRLNPAYIDDHFIVVTTTVPH
jgi:hypothetical protein